VGIQPLFEPFDVPRELKRRHVVRYEPKIRGTEWISLIKNGEGLIPTSDGAFMENLHKVAM